MIKLFSTLLFCLAASFVTAAPIDIYSDTTGAIQVLQPSNSLYVPNGINLVSRTAPAAGFIIATSFTGAGTGLTGTAASLTAGSVTTNANLTGVVTSVGNATSFAASPVFTGTTAMVGYVVSPANSSALSTIISTTPVAQVLGTDAATTSDMVYRFAADAIAPRIIMGKSRNAAIGSHTAVNSADALGEVSWCADDGTNFCTNPSVRIRGLAAAAPSGTIVQGQVQFDTQNSSGSLTTVMTLSSAAKVSISGGIQSSGTKFTASGCSNSTTVGGATAGTFASGTTGTCTVVITMNGATGVTASNGWSCWASDRTTPANLISQTASTTTTATIAGTTVSGDVISFGCMAY